jgi:Fe-S cluster assembly ATP-binding protein
MSAPLFEISGLVASATADPTAEILRGVDLTVNEGEVHAIMGPNGSGKTTLASTLMGSPEYTITAGTIRFKGDTINDWPVDERAKAGMFLAFQYPQEVSGVPVRSFLRQAMGQRKGISDMSILEVRLAMMEWMTKLDMNPAFADRHLNEGFSGGEKKRNEILQMAMLEPDFAILDETDSGLDIDALRVVANGVNQVREARPQMGTLVITHYQRLLDYLEPDFVHILVHGRIVATGGIELSEQLEREGFAPWLENAAVDTEPAR